MSPVPARIIIIGLALATLPFAWPGTTLAVPMANDPQGFGGIAWGAPFSGSDDYTLVESTARIKGYELKQGPPPMGEAKVDAMRLLTIDGKFARVMVRYQGKQTHAKMLAYLEAKYGPLDRTPGQLSVGTLITHNWRGPETEISLTFDAKQERGVIFIESRVLLPTFQDAVSDTVN